MPIRHGGPKLLGRRTECEALERMLTGVRAGQSSVRVLRGEAGVGKTVLLEYVAERATGCMVARAAGAQAEMELAFAGLQQLCAPMLDRLESLPTPQRNALGTAFGLTEGPAPDRFLVGLAVLSLMSQAADDRPLVCLLDDAQWLDRESLQALEFVGRRLLAESVALVFAVRRSGDEAPLAGLPELLVEGLVNGDARALLGSVIAWPLDERVRDQIVAETHGNPLALLELPRGLTPAEMAGGFGLPSVAPLPGRIEESFRRRLARLPASTRRLLLVAAAEPVGEPALVWRAAGLLGIEIEAAEPAEAEGLVQFGARVTFRHPLVRSAIYRAASPSQRREVHRALAQATDPQRDPDRRAWHLAQAAPGPDEEVASELERSAGRAQARGGLAAAAAFLERSAALTPEPGRRAERALAAAGAHAQAGEFDAALRLLATARAGPLEELQSAQADLLRGRIASVSGRGRDAPPLLLTAARRLEPLDVGLARETYLEALSAAQYAGPFVTDGSLRTTAEAARAAPASSQPPGAPDLLLDGLSLLITEGPAAAAPSLKRAVGAFTGTGSSAAEGERWLWLAWPSAQILWDDEAWHQLTTRGVQLARDAGALSVLPIALQQRAGLHLYEGHFAAAAATCDEAASIAEATGGALPPYVPLAIAAFRGREEEASELAETTMADVMHRGEGLGLTFVPWAMAVLYNGLARYQDALAAAQAPTEYPDEQVWRLLTAVELIEAAARSGVPEQASDALERLSRSTRASGSDWALGIEACARALVTEGERADSLHLEAIDRLGRTRIRVALARAHLVYGEWLRRDRRRTDAREQLRAAHEMFVAMGAEGFAERARRELAATGETVRRRTVETRDELTAQEAQIARLASDGHTSPEIGAQLFLSPRTVDWHLRKVFAKLGINSRRQLPTALSETPHASAPTS
jgi:DNA-binding CsgD family transcriptional regulator/tetratricopeptide (TPR) repeat protein